MTLPLKTIAQQVYERLRDEVLTGTFAPGIWIRELDLAESFGVSRTPIREALRRLAQDGLLEIAPNRGARLPQLTRAEIRDIYDMRVLLEGFAAYRAAINSTEAKVEVLEAALRTIENLPSDATADHIRADDALHAAIVDMAASASLQDLAARLNGRVMRVKTLTRDTNASELTRTQHRAIVSAIARHDADGAREAMAEHIAIHGRMV